MYRGSHQAWHWIALDYEAGERCLLHELWMGFPSIVVGRYLVNTSFDSGGLGWHEELKSKGWFTVPASTETPSTILSAPDTYRDLTHSPLIECPDELPFDQFDEWYSFDHPVHINDLRPIVNSYSGPNSAGMSVPDFWEKIERYQPVLVFGASGRNASPWFVSRDAAALDCIVGWVRTLYPDTPGQQPT